MTRKSFAEKIQTAINTEISLAAKSVDEHDLTTAFRHLERAHILGQSVTTQHTRVHWLMLRIGWKKRDWREILGQLFRIVGASTKTSFGIYPRGNTGGANVSPFKPMPVPAELNIILEDTEAE